MVQFNLTQRIIDAIKDALILPCHPIQQSLQLAIENEVIDHTLLYELSRFLVHHHLGNFLLVSYLLRDVDVQKYQFLYLIQGSCFHWPKKESQRLVCIIK